MTNPFTAIKAEFQHIADWLHGVSTEVHDVASVEAATQQLLKAVAQKLDAVKSNPAEVEALAHQLQQDAAAIAGAVVAQPAVSAPAVAAGVAAAAVGVPTAI